MDLSKSHLTMIKPLGKFFWEQDIYKGSKYALIYIKREKVPLQWKNEWHHFNQMINTGIIKIGQTNIMYLLILCAEVTSVLITFFPKMYGLILIMWKTVKTKPNHERQWNAKEPFQIRGNETQVSCVLWTGFWDRKTLQSMENWRNLNLECLSSNNTAKVLNLLAFTKGLWWYNRMSCPCSQDITLKQEMKCQLQLALKSTHEFLWA